MAAVVFRLFQSALNIQHCDLRAVGSERILTELGDGGGIDFGLSESPGIEAEFAFGIA